VTPLILRHASARPFGRWRDDDYDVLEGGVVVGRIFLSPGAPQDRQWMWASGHDGQIARAAHGFEADARVRWRRSLRAGGGLGRGAGTVRLGFIFWIPSPAACCVRCFRFAVPL
jgi:hypothetical protein